MSNNKKQLTTWEAACIITGYGIGAGVLSMPYMAARNGIIVSTLILILALLASYVLHLMIAEIAFKEGNGGQIISCLNRFLFRGKWKKPLSVIFFTLMAVILVTNLAAYISGAEEVIVGLLPIPPIAAKLLFYAVAASVVLFGLKAVGVSEKIAVTVIFGLIGVLAVASFIKARNPLSLSAGTVNDALAYYGLAMFAMSAFFSVPQAVEGLGGDKKKIHKAVFIGLFNTFLLILVISVCSLISSTEVTELAMVGWSQGIGLWAQVIGSLFTILAMLTTYWSLSLALGGIVSDMLHTGTKISWLLATLPSLIVVLFNLAGFMELMRTAGGLIAILIAVMVVPAYHNARKEAPEHNLIQKSGLPLELAIVAAYILMAVGSVVPV
ncbi:MAG: aromatic amino acid transport family protein [Acutalibacteraceae bacterium]